MYRTGYCHLCFHHDNNISVSLSSQLPVWSSPTNVNKLNMQFVTKNNTILYGRVVKCMGHLGHDEAMEAGSREFEPRDGTL